VSDSIIEKISELKKKHNAVILAHNYQRGEIQDVADFVGDSLGLSQQAARTDAGLIVFCGVHFMAETAALLSPDKTVIMPDEHAGCPMASMITARELKEKKKLYPNAKVVCYVNTTAAVKAESDICCTSSNAVRIVSSIPEDEDIIFVPDKSLGAYVSSCLGRDMIYWDGYSPTHNRSLAEQITKMKSEHPEAEVVVHPECTPDVIALADHVASTTGILNYAKSSNSKEFVIGTEIGILHRMKKENPDKTFMPVTPLSDCPNMKLNTLEKLLWSLEDIQFVVTVPEEIAVEARKAIQRMLELSR